jgi:hypothetical protein
MQATGATGLSFGFGTAKGKQGVSTAPSYHLLKTLAAPRHEVSVGIQREMVAAKLPVFTPVAGSGNRND